MESEVTQTSVIPTDESAEVQVDVLSGGPEIVMQLAAEWSEFLDSAQNDLLYWRPEWLLAALRAYWPKAKLLIIVARRADRLCAILPLIEKKSKFAGLPARKLMAPLVRSGMGMDILLSATPNGAVQAIWDFLRQRNDWDVIELPAVFEGAAIEQFINLAKKHGMCTGSWPQPVIAFFVLKRGTDPAKELENYPRHPKLRAKVRQREAKLAALGSVRLVRVEKNATIYLRRFYEMEASGWKGQTKSAILCRPDLKQFFDEVVREAERLGYLCLYFLELDGKPIAAHIGFIYRGRYWAAKSTYDENYRDYAPGHVIVKAILRDLVDRGISEYVMGVREDWKLEWTEDVWKRNYYCIFADRLWARLLYWIQFALRRKTAAFKGLATTFAACMSRRSHATGQRANRFDGSG